MADTDDDLIARHVDGVMRQLQTVYEASRDDPDRYLRASEFVIQFSVRPSEVPPVTLHDDDYRVFRNFTDESDLIIDIGANSGYSAESIWASGSGARVLSFEALHFHHASLAALKTAYGDRYDYRMRGLSNAPAVLDFVIPVVNGVALTSLATAWSDIHWPSLAENTIRFGDLEAYRNNRPVDLDLAFYQANVERLDDALKQLNLTSHNTSISAIKIDVEGLEPEVVEGAHETLCRHKPLLLIEAAQYRAEMLATLKDMGYLIARRCGDVLEQTQELPPGLNTFFWHVDQRNFYETSGLLKPRRSVAVSVLRNWFKSVASHSNP